MTIEAAGLKITILVDNRASDGLAAEHGFALWIEADGRRILFDTGQGGALAANARALGVELCGTDTIVLSHGHYDHTGGIAHVLEKAPGAVVCCHPAALQPRLSIRDGGATPVGMPGNVRAAVESLPPDRLRWVSQPLMLSECVGITGPIPRNTDFEDTGGPFYLDPAGRHPDPLDDDLAIWIRVGGRLVVCTGCSHAGLVNTLRHARHLAGDALPIEAIIGGFHLGNAAAPRLDQTVAALRECAPEHLIPCHCTGDRAVAILADAFGGRTRQGSAGLVLQF